QPSWYQGRDAITAFLRGWPLSHAKRFRLLPTRASGQPAFAVYLWDDEASRFGAESIVVLTLRGDRIAEVTAFRTPQLFPLFRLPQHLPTRASRTRPLITWRTP